MNEKRSPLYNLTLIFLSVYVLIALTVEAFFISDKEIAKTLQYIDLFICFIFLFDFFTCFWAAESKLKYMKWGWIDFVSSIPAIDPLRWGRVSRLIRVFRYLRAIKSMKVLITSLHVSKYETLTLCMFLVVFVSFTLSAAFILEFERGYSSAITSAETALWWSFLNIMNTKVITYQAVSSEGIILSSVLNKVGFLLFAYFNSMLIAWLVSQRQNKQTLASSTAEDA